VVEHKFLLTSLVTWIFNGIDVCDAGVIGRPKESSAGRGKSNLGTHRGYCDIEVIRLSIAYDVSNKCIVIFHISSTL
jgi:hypothetical protein